MTKRLLGLTGVAFVVFAACHNPQSIATPKPSRQMAAVSGKSYEGLKHGHEVYQQKCAQCHVHRLPVTATLPQWHRKVEAMATKAQLSAEEEKNLQLYLDEFSDR